MYNPSRHPQVQYSLQELTRSLFTLMQEIPFAEISVTQICEQATLARRTFYRNCDSKEDLILYACDHLSAMLLAGADLSSTDARTMYRYFFSFWYNHRTFLQMLYKQGLLNLFTERFIVYCGEQMSFPLQEESLGGRSKAAAMRDFNNSFILGGMTAMLCAWAKEGFRSSVETLVESILFLLPAKYRAPR